MEVHGANHTFDKDKSGCIRKACQSSVVFENLICQSGIVKTQII